MQPRLAAVCSTRDIHMARAQAATISGERDRSLFYSFSFFFKKVDSPGYEEKRLCAQTQVHGVRLNWLGITMQDLSARRFKELVTRTNVSRSR